MSVVLFTDRDLGHSVPDALAAAGYQVERHDDHFDPLTPDTVWIGEIGRRGWVAFTHNRDIRYRTQQRDMVMRAGVALFILIGHAPHGDLARNLVQTMPRVLGLLDEREPPFIAKVYRPSPSSSLHEGKPGRVHVWLDQDEWRRIMKPS